jgi:hypothetical protein
MRWLQVTPPVQTAFATNCEKSLLDKFCQVLNLLSSSNWGDVLKDDKQDFEYFENDAEKTYLECHLIQEQIQTDWDIMLTEKVGERKLFCYELPEDRSLLGLQGFGDILAELKSKVLSEKSMVSTREKIFTDEHSKYLSTKQYEMSMNIIY